MSSASELKHCPKCDSPIPAEAPQGLCPQCLLLQASLPTEAGAGSPQKSPAPTLEELAGAFSQLEILELIGQGGMGFVFKARQPKLERFVALKILPQSLAADPAFAERFTREGRALARLNHPNIVTIHDFGEAHGFFYLLMEYVDGVNLRQAMKVGRFTPDQALAIVPKICDALQFAHNEGILHRDIKPENILLDAKGRVKIADFGIAKITGTEMSRSGGGDLRSSDAPNATGLIGTPQYMAPEQIEHPKQADQRADVYSLGVVFYEMLTGELPVGRFAPPSEKSTADPRLDQVVMRALEKEPTSRTQSAGELKTQVETFTGTTSIPPFLDESKTVAGTSIGFSFRGMAPFLRRGLRVGLFIFLTSVALAAVSSLLLPKTYMATARVEVSVGANAIYDPYRIQVEINTIQSPDFCREIVSSLNLAQRWSVKSGGAVTEEVAVEWLKMQLELRTSRNTSLLEISFVDELPTEAAEIANRIAESYCNLPPGNRGRIIDRALPPSKAFRPNIPLNIGVGMVAGLVAGIVACAITVLFHFWNGTKDFRGQQLNRGPAMGLGMGSQSSALNAVALLFVAYGFLGFWIFSEDIRQGYVAADFLLLGVPIGIGLLRRRRWWRLTAMAFVVLSMLNLRYTLSSPVLHFFGYAVFKRPFLGFLLAPGLFVAFLICAYLILRRPNVIEVFRDTGFNRPWIEWTAFGIVLMSLLGLSKLREPNLHLTATALPEVSQTPAIKQLKTGTGSFTAQVGQGTIELVAVGTGDSHYPSTNSFDWWKPDGTPIERLRYEYPPGDSSVGGGDSIYRQLVLRTSGLPAGSSPLSIAEAETARSYGPVGPIYLDGKIQPDITLGNLELAPTTKVTRIKIIVAIAPWVISPPVAETLRSGGGAGIGFDNAGVHWRVKLQDIEEINGATKIIAYHTDRKGWQSELFFIDSIGKEWIPQGRAENSEGLCHLSGTINLPLANIKASYLRIRPYQSVEFRNVSLVRGQRTDVEIVEMPLTTSAEPPSKAPGQIAEKRAKRITISKVTEENHRISAWTDSSFEPGETVAAVVKLPDGKLEDAMVQTMTIRGNSGRRVTTAFSWQLPNSFDLEALHAAKLLAQKNSALEKSILLEVGRSISLFAATNRAGGAIEAFLMFVPMEHPPRPSSMSTEALMHFNMATNINHMVLGYFDPTAPFGSILEAVAVISGRVEADAHTSIAHSANYKAGNCRYDFPSEFTAKEMASAVEQINALKRGFTIIAPDTRVRLFSVTNNAGATYEGFFELRAPHFNSGNDSASPQLTNQVSNTNETEEAAQVKLKFAEERVKEAQAKLANGIASTAEYQDAKLARDLASISLRKLQNNSSNAGAIDEVAQVKLKYAEEKVKEAEKRSEIGAIDPLSLQKTVADRDIIIAEMKGDAVEVARIKLKVAESEFFTAERRRENGVASTEEYENAKLARDLAAIALRHLQKAKGE
jgi:serine/threonine protein kinase